MDQTPRSAAFPRYFDSTYECSCSRFTGRFVPFFSEVCLVRSLLPLRKTDVIFSRENSRVYLQLRFSCAPVPGLCGDGKEKLHRAALRLRALRTALAQKPEKAPATGAFDLR